MNVPFHKIVHCAETIKGGIASYLRDLIPLQCREIGSTNIWVIIPSSQSNELPLPFGVNLVLFDDTGSRLMTSFRCALQVLKISRLIKPSVVHVHSTFAGATVRPLLMLGYRDARVIYCAHGWAWDRPMSVFGRYVTKLLERLLAHISDKIICISKYEFINAEKAGLPVGKLALVRNAVKEQQPRPSVINSPLWPLHTKRVLFVGRLDEQKGVDVLVAALEQLGEAFHAVIAGSSVVSSRNKFKIPKNATEIGWVSPSELEFLFSKAEVLVVPSRWEGFGLIAVEAMRAGLPVVATRVGGLSEIVEDGVTGYLVPPDSSVSLANVLRILDESCLKKMGEAGRIRFQDLFSLERLHQEIWHAYGLDC